MLRKILILLWDGMFTDEELKMRKGWGHSSISQGAEFLVSTNVRNWPYATIALTEMIKK